MKGALIIIILITLLIIGILMIKNYNSGVTKDSVIKKEAIEMTKEIAEKANKATQKIKDLNKQLTGSD